MRLSQLAALCLLLFLPCGASADDIGPAQAQALQQQLKDWLAGLLGPAVKLPEPPWRITGEHDHYVITWPIPGLTSPAGEVATTANVRPLDGGRWSIDAMKMPPSGTFTMTIPNAGDDGKDASMDMQFSIGRQDTHGVIDPGLRQRIHAAHRVRRPGGVLDRREAAPGAALRSLCRGHHPDADPERTARSHHGPRRSAAGNPPRRSAAVRR